MIRCPSCDISNIHVESGCPQCGFVPAQVDVFNAWSPELAKENDVFRKESFDCLARLEQSNFWFWTCPKTWTLSSLKLRPAQRPLG